MPSLIDILVILLVTTGPTKAMILFAQVTQGYSARESAVALRAVLVSAIVLLRVRLPRQADPGLVPHHPGGAGSWPAA